MNLTTHLHQVPRSKNARSYTSTPPICLHGMVLFKKHRDNFISLHYQFRHEPFDFPHVLLFSVTVISSVLLGLDLGQALSSSKKYDKVIYLVSASNGCSF
jgi:hypothetical protein